MSGTFFRAASSVIFVLNCFIDKSLVDKWVSKGASNNGVFGKECKKVKMNSENAKILILNQ